MHPRDIFTKTYKATKIKIKNMACFRKHIKGCDTAWQNIYGIFANSVKADQVMTTMYKRITQPKHGEARKTFVPI